MKIYVFDFDNTIFSRKVKIVHPNTLKLLKTISNNKNNILILATGRKNSEIKEFNELDGLFDYIITLNGAVIQKGHEMIYEIPIPQSIVKSFFDLVKNNAYFAGFASKTTEFVFNLRKNFERKIPNDSVIIDSIEQINQNIYQMWIAEDKPIIQEVAMKIKALKTLFWHKDGAHFVLEYQNKASALTYLMNMHKPKQVIAVGDGENDIEMLKLADIGIALSNSHSIELKSCANLIGPHIDDDDLLSFFLKNDLI